MANEFKSNLVDRLRRSRQPDPMRIRPFSTPGRFWRGNLHAHSNLSDGALNPAEVVEAYKRAGYDFLQVSDHFLGRFDWPIADTRRLRRNCFTTLIGA